MSDFMVKPIKSDRKVIKSVDLAKWEKDLRNTNVYAEVRGKYARAPVMNGPFTCKSNDYQTFFKFDSDKNSTEKHISILDKRRKFIKHFKMTHLTTRLKKKVHKFTKSLQNIKT